MSEGLIFVFFGLAVVVGQCGVAARFALEDEHQVHREVVLAGNKAASKECVRFLDNRM